MAAITTKSCDVFVILSTKNGEALDQSSVSTPAPRLKDFDEQKSELMPA